MPVQQASPQLPEGLQGAGAGGGGNLEPKVDMADLQARLGKLQNSGQDGLQQRLAALRGHANSTASLDEMEARLQKLHGRDKQSPATMDELRARLAKLIGHSSGPAFDDNAGKAFLERDMASGPQLSEDEEAGRILEAIMELESLNNGMGTAATAAGADSHGGSGGAEEGAVDISELMKEAASLYNEAQKQVLSSMAHARYDLDLSLTEGWMPRGWFSQVKHAAKTAGEDSSSGATGSQEEEAANAILAAAQAGVKQDGSLLTSWANLGPGFTDTPDADSNAKDGPASDGSVDDHDSDESVASTNSADG